MKKLELLEVMARAMADTIVTGVNIDSITIRIKTTIEEYHDYENEFKELPNFENHNIDSMRLSATYGGIDFTILSPSGYVRRPELFGAGVLYKGVKCRVTKIPSSYSDYYLLMPYKRIDDIGNGPGGSVSLPVMQFEKEVSL